MRAVTSTSTEHSSDEDILEQLVDRDITDVQWQRFEGYMREIFQALGMQLSTPGTTRTPTRFLKALFDATSRIRNFNQASFIPLRTI